MDNFFEEFTMSLEILNPYNDESITFRGIVLNWFMEGSNPEGLEHLLFYQAVQGQGTGNMGNKYFFAGIASEIINPNPQEIEVAEVVAMNKVISEDPAPGFTLVIENKITIDPNEDISMDTDFYSAY
ncbi:hypothetical protein [Domibacillus iocasae]|uniref:Uncharacterized protein n=1 Tax=Domibacillus iocasae TaxID=1714016 RepID=A0A1E7DM96_9BACI|nr:hypothetical protein [Domibacillus iocasae]OES44207.1 hypothetical protein BA724_07905 [Domibacillus iocasae]